MAMKRYGPALAHTDIALASTPGNLSPLNTDSIALAAAGNKRE